MNKRVHQIAKEHGLAAKEVLERLRAAGLSVKAVSSSVDEDVARRVLGDGDGNAATPPAAAQAQPATAQRADGGRRAGGGAGARPDAGGGRTQERSARGRAEGRS